MMKYIPETKSIWIVLEWYNFWILVTKMSFQSSSLKDMFQICLEPIYEK